MSLTISAAVPSKWARGLLGLVYWSRMMPPGISCSRRAATPMCDSGESKEAKVGVRLEQEIPGGIILDQYTNPSNPLAHFDGTAAEIVRDTEGHVDMVVCGAGTGGTIAGIARKMKQACPKCIVVGVDPMGSIIAQPEDINATDVSYYDVEASATTSFQQCATERTWTSGTNRMIW